MVSRLVPLLAPIGIAIVLLISSLNGYSALTAIGQCLYLESDYIRGVRPATAFGELGLLIFGFGVAWAAMLPRKRTPLVIGSLIGAIVLLSIACLLIGALTIVHFFAFSSLAASENLDADPFLKIFSWTKIPLLIGWFFAMAGATLLFVSGKSPAGGLDEPVRMKLKVGFWISIIAVFIFLLAAVYGISSYLAITRVLSNQRIDVIDLVCINGVFMARLVSLIGIGATIIASIAMAFSARPTASLDVS